MIKFFTQNKINFKQVLMLFGSNVLLILIGFGIKNIQTNELGEINYGEYTFFITFISFIALFFRFGFFISIQNLLAQNYNVEKSKNYLGAGFVITLIIGICLSLVLWIFSYFINDIFNTSIGNTLRMFAPLTIIFPFQFLFNSYSVGTNKINVNVWYSLLPKTLFLLALIICFSYNKINLQSVVLLNLSATAIIILYYFFKLKPSFVDFRKYLGIIWKKNKKFGFQYYKGAISNQTTYKLDGLLLSAFHSTTLLGYYSLALLVTSPMLFLSKSLSKSMYKKFADYKVIPKEIFIFNTVWLIGCMVFFYFFSEFLVRILFGENFIIVAEYTFYLTFVLFFHGLSGPYSFLTAKSKGKEMKKIAYLEAVFNIVGNLILIPIYGIKGAILASLFAKMANYFYSRYFYKKYLNTVVK
jgi:O-antigen/teichoic acid export membrane protein